MTLITRPVRRESLGTVWEQGRRRPVIVSMEPPNLLGFRLKKTRQTYYLTVEAAYLLAVRASVEAKKREKREARKEKSRG